MAAQKYFEGGTSGPVFVLLFVTSASWAGDLGHARELSDRASQLYNQARFAEAEPLYRRAIEAWTEAGAESAHDLAIDKRNLGVALRAMGRFDEAKPVLLESVSELAAAGASYIDQSRALINLAAVYRAQGDAAKAEAFAVGATAVLEKLQDGTPAERLGPRVLLASIYIDQQRLTEAESILRSGLDAADGALATAIYGDLATISIRRGNFKEAESMARQALHFAGLALPATHPLLAASWNNLGQACRLRGDYLHAEQAYREAIDIWEKSLGPSHPDVAKGLMNLGALYHERGRESGAEILYRRAIAILERYFGLGNPQTFVARSQLADILRAQRRFAESKMLCQNTLHELEKMLPPGDLRLRQAQSNCTRLPGESGR